MYHCFHSYLCGMHKCVYSTLYISCLLHKVHLAAVSHWSHTLQVSYFQVSFNVAWLVSSCFYSKRLLEAIVKLCFYACRFFCSLVPIYVLCIIVKANGRGGLGTRLVTLYIQAFVFVCCCFSVLSLLLLSFDQNCSLIMQVKILVW